MEVCRRPPRPSPAAGPCRGRRRARPAAPWLGASLLLGAAALPPLGLWAAMGAGIHVGVALAVAVSLAAAVPLSSMGALAVRRGGRRAQPLRG